MPKDICLKQTETLTVRSCGNLKFKRFIYPCNTEISKKLAVIHVRSNWNLECSILRREEIAENLVKNTRKIHEAGFGIVTRATFTALLVRLASAPNTTPPYNRCSQ